MDPIDTTPPRSLPSTSNAASRLLVVLEAGADRERIASVLVQEGHDFACLDQLESARVAVLRERFDLVLVGTVLPDGDGLEVADLLQRLSPSTKVVALGQTASFQGAVEAMRRGAVDFLPTPLDESQLRTRIRQALGKCRFDREREQRIHRLKSICRKLSSARHEISQQVDLLCNDLVHAYQEIAGQMNEVAMVSEFRTLIRQELDIEGLLRTALEYLLTKTGPTNAAVFLPGEEGDYNLGAYVNYDCPRETADVLLQHLGDRVCTQMEHESELVRFADANEFAEYVGEAAEVIADSQVIAFSARHDDETMAIVVLFRRTDEPYLDSLGQVIELLRPIFAEQIATIVRVHNRARPEWPQESFDDMDDDGGEWGLAA